MNQTNRRQFITTVVAASGEKQDPPHDVPWSEVQPVIAKVRKQA